VNEKITDVEVARVTIIRFMGDGPENDYVEVESSEGMDQISALGMIRAAEHGILAGEEY
jgi:hypothetical protein